MVPGLFLGGSLPVTLLLVPDLGAVAAVAGTLALVWAALRAVVAARLLRRPAVTPGGRMAQTPGV